MGWVKIFRSGIQERKNKKDKKMKKKRPSWGLKMKNYWDGNREISNDSGEKESRVKKRNLDKILR